MDIMDIILSLVILIFSAILHELAHGYVADRFGDPTPRLSGRLTLNPKSHIDPFMSILLPLALFISGSPVIFGAAKPVPIDPFNFREGRKDVALVALSGPLMNLLLAIAASLLLRFFGTVFAQSANDFFSVLLIFTLKKIIDINLLLAIFNLLPIPPLDGSKVFSLILPPREAAAYLSIGTIGMFILFFLLMFPLGGFSLNNFIFNLLSFAENILLR